MKLEFSACVVGVLLVASAGAGISCGSSSSGGTPGADEAGTDAAIPSDATADEVAPIDAPVSTNDAAPPVDGATVIEAASTSDGAAVADGASVADGQTSTDSSSSTDGPPSLDSSSTTDGASAADSGHLDAMSSPETSSTTITGPCDLYAAGGAPCVAAHSTVRALYGAYEGRLYQVTRAKDKTTMDIDTLSAGGFANSATQDSFCSGTTCTITILYDQSSKGNHLTPGPGGGAVATADNPASATSLKITASGHSVYGIRITPPGEGYRIDNTSGVATADEPETEYMVTSSQNLVNGCCFDYGNAETNNHDDGAATMEAVYFGFGVVWGTGTGTGPWVEADLENGLFAGGPGATKGVATNMSLTSAFVTAMVVGRSGTFALKGGNAQSGTLTTMYDGARPAGYNPMKKQGSIILGIGGDNSNGAGGDFYEGVMTSGNASAATDDAVQANVIAAGYGH